MARLGLRWKSERAWYGENGLEVEKRMRMVWRDLDWDGKANAHGMARLGLRWKNERAWYGEIWLDTEKRTRMVWRDRAEATTVNPYVPATKRINPRPWGY